MDEATGPTTPPMDQQRPHIRRARRSGQTIELARLPPHRELPLTEGQEAELDRRLRQAALPEEARAVETGEEA